MQSNIDFCFYHNHFGHQARKCLLPCNFKKLSSHPDKDQHWDTSVGYIPLFFETRYVSILNEFPSITEKPNYNKPAKHPIVAKIFVTSESANARACGIRPEFMRQAEKIILQMEQDGILELAYPAFISPMHLILKDDKESLEVVGNFRELNRVSEQMRYPLPRIHSAYYRLHGCKVFSTLKLKKLIYEIPLDKQSQRHTGINTPFGVFKFKRLPMGLTCTNGYIQKLLDFVLEDVPNTFGYIDVVLVYSTTPEEHVKHLRQTFQAFEKYGLHLDRFKSLYGTAGVQFLGHFISYNGWSPCPQKIREIEEFPTPKTSHEVLRFVGMLQFYSSNIPELSKKLAPLHDLIKGKRTKNWIISWTQKAETAFQEVKTALLNLNRLTYYIPGERLYLFTNASDVAVGAVLSQKLGDTLKPIQFFSHSLSASQRQYSKFDRELEAMCMAIKHFYHLISGKPLTIFTDCKLLVIVFHSSHHSCTARQDKALDYIFETTEDIQYLEETQNVVADKASCSTFNAILYKDLVIDWGDLLASQYTDPDIKRMMDSPRIPLAMCYYPEGNIDLFCVNGDPKNPRAVIPKAYRKPIYDSIHDKVHVTTKTMIRFIQKHCTWPKMKTDIAKWSKSCNACHKTKMKHINVDILDAFEPSNNYRYILLMLDHRSLYAMAVPLKNKTTTTIIEAFVKNWVPQWNFPSLISSDRKSQFTSFEWRDAMIDFGVIHQTHQGYDSVDYRIVKFKRSLLAITNKRDWSSEILYFIRSHNNEKLHVSDAEILDYMYVAIQAAFGNGNTAYTFSSHL